MSRNTRFTLRLAVSLMAAALAAGPALADKPSRPGGKHGKQGDDRQYQRRDDDRHGGVDIRFSVDSRHAINDYYGAQFRAGKCPPGLAKKHNGCLPPGQAKKWAMGRPLPPDVRYYDLPHDLLIQLPVPPPNYRYVRVASDILLITVGTAMVADAIEDIGR